MANALVLAHKRAKALRILFEALLTLPKCPQLTAVLSRHNELELPLPPTDKSYDKASVVTVDCQQTICSRMFAPFPAETLVVLHIAQGPRGFPDLTEHVLPNETKVSC